MERDEIGPLYTHPTSNWIGKAKLYLSGGNAEESSGPGVRKNLSN